MKVSMQQAVKSIGIILCLLLISSVIGVYIHVSGYAQLQCQGLAYMNTSPDKYVVTHQINPKAYTMEIDLDNLDSNIGKRFWVDDEQYIEVDFIDRNVDGVYLIFFRSHGIYNFKEGKLTTGVDHAYYGDGTNNWQTGKLITTYNNKSYQYHSCGGGGLGAFPDGDQFGFFLFSREAYEDGIVPAENVGTATITLYNLTEHTWTRIE